MTTTIKEVATKKTIERMSYWKAEKLMTEFAREFLKNEYGLKLDIPIKVNPRTSITHGMFYFNPKDNIAVRISISKSMIEYNEESFAISTLKHELVHYALFELGLPYHDGDKEFEKELKRVGASSTGVRVSINKEEIYECKKCNYRFHQLRKLDHHKKYQGSNYSCQCGGRLRYIGQHVPTKRLELVNV